MRELSYCLGLEAPRGGPAFARTMPSDPELCPRAPEAARESSPEPLSKHDDGNDLTEFDCPTLPSLPWADPRRVARVVQEHSAFIFRLLRRFGVTESALDDATQQVFIVAAKKLPAIPSDRERQFLCGIAVRVAANFRRLSDRHGRRHFDAVLEDLESNCHNAEVLVAQKQARHALELILDAMTTELRTVFVLCELEGLTAPAAAAIVDAPIGTVSSRLRRAREQFRAAASQLRAEHAQSTALQARKL